MTLLAEVAYDQGSTSEETIRNIKAAFNLAAQSVSGAMGIEYNVNSDGNVIEDHTTTVVKAVKSSFPGATEVIAPTTVPTAGADEDVYNFLKFYNGSFAFLNDMKDNVAKFGSLKSQKQIDAVRKCMKSEKANA